MSPGIPANYQLASPSVVHQVESPEQNQNADAQKYVEIRKLMSPSQDAKQDEVFGDVAPVAANQAVADHLDQLAGMNKKDSLMFRLEKTRMYLEQMLGFDKFFQVYQIINESYGGTSDQIDEKRIKELLGDASGYVNMIAYLILMEREAN